MVHPSTIENDSSHGLATTRSGHEPGRKNTTKVFVVMYPSNATSTVILTNDKKAPENYGFGICVKPKKKSKARFWTESGPEPILFTVEDYGQDGLTMRSGHGVGEENMVLRILVAEKDDFATDSEFEECFTPLVEAGKRKADTTWITDCLSKLQDRALVPSFDLDIFAVFLRSILEEQGLWSQRKHDAPVTINYLDHLASSNHPPHRRESLGYIVLEKLRKTSSPKGVEKVLRLN